MRHFLVFRSITALPFGVGMATSPAGLIAVTGSTLAGLQPLDMVAAHAFLHPMGTAAANAGRLFRPDAPLLPNYKYVPVAYNGRANSIRVSGDRVQRPWGQLKAADAPAPVFAPRRC